MKQLVTILGARPQFIKAAALSKEIFSLRPKWREVIVHTGQHFDDNMSDVFFRELGIASPEYNLGIHGLHHGAMTGRMMEQIESVLLKLEPDMVCVYGDTNSTIAGSLVAAKLHIPVCHVEAGLRSFNRRMPEELNRVVTDHLSDLLFVPTKLARENLLREGIPAEKIHQVGDIMFDTLRLFQHQAQESRIVKELMHGQEEYFLATLHRAENTDNRERLLAIVQALEETAQHIRVIIPLHPRTQYCMRKFGMNFTKVRAIPPVGYLDMMALQMHASLIITDSGGVQKEAFFHKVHCITVRDETEWMELVEAGWNTLAPPEVLGSILLECIHSRPSEGANTEFYGDGFAARRIMEVMEAYTNGRSVVESE